MTSPVLCVTPLACSAPAKPWLRRLLAATLKALTARPRRGPTPPGDLDLLSLAHLDEATLKDIGVPDGVRHYAARQREQAALLRHIEIHHGGTNVTHW